MTGQTCSLSRIDVNRWICGVCPTLIQNPNDATVPVPYIRCREYDKSKKNGVTISRLERSGRVHSINYSHFK